MMLLLLTIVMSFIVSSLFGYTVHWILHRPWSKALYRMHLRHHTLYTAEDYLSDIYRSAGRDNTFFIFAAAAIPLVMLPIVLWWLNIMPLALMLVAVGEMLLLGFLHEYIHTAFHIRWHWMNRLAAFRRWNKLHFLHHQDIGTNYGIFWFGLDRLFGTFWNEE